MSSPVAQAGIVSPRIVVRYCTQCKWMLRAAYYAQELLSTFGTALGEVALQPATGGTFTVDIYVDGHVANGQLSEEGAKEGQGPESQGTDAQATVPRPTSEKEIQVTRLWDRKAEGGFPETKELKRLVRDVVEPGRDLGHVDRKKGEVEKVQKDSGKEGSAEDKRDTKDTSDTKCEDCK